MDLDIRPLTRRQTPDGARSAAPGDGFMKTTTRGSEITQESKGIQEV
jgi:hypothetical protein